MAEEFTAAEREAIDVWTRIRDGTGEHVRDWVRDHARSTGAALAGAFYERMLTHDRAHRYLTHEVVDRKLRAAMRRWLDQVFSADTPAEIHAAVALQASVGGVHARIRIPLDLIGVGIMELVGRLRFDAAQAPLSETQRCEAAAYASDLLHHTNNLMSAAYVDDARGHARRDEIYRSVAQRHGLTHERVRQRADLSEWVESVLFRLYDPASAGWVKIRESAFGVWMLHKGRVLFDGFPQLEDVLSFMRVIDEVLLPQLASGGLAPEDRARLIARLRADIDSLRLSFSDAFDRVEIAEGNRDVVTQLPSATLIPPILSRELDLHTSANSKFSLLSIEIGLSGIDSSDADGIAAQRMLLQRVASVLVREIGSGDHAFRNGDTRFLVVLVEADGALASGAALRIQESLAHEISGAHVRGAVAGVVLRPAIGVATFDGHPDFHQLVLRADAALSKAIAEPVQRIQVG